MSNENSSMSDRDLAAIVVSFLENSVAPTTVGGTDEIKVLEVLVNVDNDAFEVGFSPQEAEARYADRMQRCNAMPTSWARQNCAKQIKEEYTKWKRRFRAEAQARAQRLQQAVAQRAALAQQSGYDSSYYGQPQPSYYGQPQPSYYGQPGYYDQGYYQDPGYDPYGGYVPPDQQAAAATVLEYTSGVDEKDVSKNTEVIIKLDADATL